MVGPADTTFISSGGEYKATHKTLPAAIVPTTRGSKAELHDMFNGAFAPAALTA
jgi:hypothetical protein